METHSWLTTFQIARKKCKCNQQHAFNEFSSIQSTRILVSQKSFNIGPVYPQYIYISTSVYLYQTNNAYTYTYPVPAPMSMLIAISLVSNEGRGTMGNCSYRKDNTFLTISPTLLCAPTVSHLDYLSPDWSLRFYI